MPLEQGEQSDLVAAVTEIVRKADRYFERVGGSSRHWVRDCFLPALDAGGFLVVRQVNAHLDVLCRHCNEELRMLDGQWCDRETHTICPDGDAVANYMRECMAMPDSATDQEQNWIAGHMHTFTVAALTTLQAERDTAVLRLAQLTTWMGVPFDADLLDAVAQSISRARSKADAERDRLRVERDDLQIYADEKRDLELRLRSHIERAEVERARLREALESARFYVEAYTGATGLTAGMAEQELTRINAALLRDPETATPTTSND